MWTPKGAALIWGPALIKGNMVNVWKIFFITKVQHIVALYVTLFITRVLLKDIYF